RIEGGELEGVDRVHRRVDVVERGLELFDADRRADRLVLDLTRLLPEHLRGRFNDITSRSVQGANLVEHQLLVAKGERGDHRRAKRRHGGGRGALDALDQLDVVPSNEIEGDIALNADRELGQ